jgi:dTDP-4-dehydrorhamnose reductase
MKKTVLVTGGSGLIGSGLKTCNVNFIFLSSKDCDLRDLTESRAVFNKYNRVT